MLWRGSLLLLGRASLAGRRVLAEAGRCPPAPVLARGGRRVLLEGRAVVRSDGVRPTHLLVWASGPDGGEVLVLVERGDRGVSPWPAEGTTAGEIGFEAVRLDADRVVSGTLA